MITKRKTLTVDEKTHRKLRSLAFKKGITTAALIRLLLESKVKDILKDTKGQAP